MNDLWSDTRGKKQNFDYLHWFNLVPNDPFKRFLLGAQGKEDLGKYASQSGWEMTVVDGLVGVGR